VGAPYPAATPRTPMDKLFNRLRLHALALLAGIVAVLMWKDYFTHPHHPVTAGQLTELSGELTLSGHLVSLPSGSGAGSFVLLKESQRSFDVPGSNYDFNNEVPKGARVTVTYSPEEDVSRSGESVSIFSLKYKEKDYLASMDRVASFNENIATKRNRALGWTAGAFLAFGLVEVVRRRFLKT
jgi:hypothetical protein